MTPRHPSPQTIYFGYGSNLWLEQMHTRCPTSAYLGVARLSNYHWLINDRGYANIVEQPRNDKSKDYDNVVFGLVYALTPADEQKLDRNEGVPVAYTKEVLCCDFWAGGAGRKVDTTRRPDESREMLVYIDRKRVAPAEPREEYIYRMNRGIEDGLRMGMPEGYVKHVMRTFIPAEEGEGRRSMEQFAKGQAAQFRDESGVFQ